MSYAENIAVIMEICRQLNPRAVLDIGTGFGKYGFLVRERLLSEKANKGDLYPQDNCIIDCVEETPYFYGFPFHQTAYNNLYHQNVFLVSDEILRKYDLMLLIDIVEHWGKEAALSFLNRLELLERRFLVSTPKKVVIYDPKYYGCEKHKTQFFDADFRKFNVLKNFSNELSYIYLLGT